jgi:hypothetical protein
MRFGLRSAISDRGTLATYLFKSFIQAGFECSTHKLRGGRRLDMVAATQHDRFVEQDYDAILALGMRTVREGIRWPRIEQSDGTLDFSSVCPILNAARQRGIEIVWDMFHFGWPDRLDIFSPAWLDAFERLAEAFALVLKAECPARAMIAPMNEISFVAWAGGDTAYLNPFCKCRGHELKRQLVRAYVRGAAAVRRVLPDALLVSPEPVIHIVGRPGVPGDAEQAEAYRMAMFEAWDMVLGRVHRDLGGSEDNIDVFGCNYYDRNQWYNFGGTIYRNDPNYRPFHQILQEVFERYRRPLFISETGTENDARAGWFAYVAEETRKANSLQIPVEGICLYPILNHPGWDDDRHCHNGLFDYASSSGRRPAYQPLANEILKQEEIRLTGRKTG